jgi:hypothetical protein
MKTSSKDSNKPRFYVVKHGLDAFEALPNFIWNSGVPRTKYPRGFKQIKPGDRWIGFAHTSSDRRERPLSRVTGFFECIRSAMYKRVPPKAYEAAQYTKGAWFIEGKPIGRQPEAPVGVPSISVLLKRQTFNQTTFVPISGGEFERIRAYVERHEFNAADIPLLGREPNCEQEVLAIVLSGHEDLGIEKIDRVRTGFPDLLVKLRGKKDPVHLELETYSSSFLDHGHQHAILKGGFATDSNSGSSRSPVGVLCWIDDDKHRKHTRSRPAVRSYVQRVFELQSLLRNKKRIRW